MALSLVLQLRQRHQGRKALATATIAVGGRLHGPEGHLSLILILLVWEGPVGVKAVVVGMGIAWSATALIMTITMATRDVGAGAAVDVADDAATAAVAAGIGTAVEGHGLVGTGRKQQIKLYRQQAMKKEMVSASWYVRTIFYHSISCLYLPINRTNIAWLFCPRTCSRRRSLWRCCLRSWPREPPRARRPASRSRCRRLRRPSSRRCWNNTRCRCPRQLNWPEPCYARTPPCCYNCCCGE